MKVGVMRDGESSSGVSVKPVSADEWKELKALRLEALQREPAAFATTYAQAATWPDEAWRERITNPRCVTLMARAGRRPAGMIGACRGDDGDERVGVIVSMYVNELYRRRGVGRKLLAAAIETLRGVPEIETMRLWVNRTHLPARRLYEALGFRLVEDPAEASGEAAEIELLVMERPVERHHPWSLPSALEEGWR